MIAVSREEFVRHPYWRRHTAAINAFSTPQMEAYGADQDAMCRACASEFWYLIEDLEDVLNPVEMGHA